MAVYLKTGKKRIAYASRAKATHAARVGSAIFKSRFCVVSKRKHIGCWKNGKRVK